MDKTKINVYSLYWKASEAPGFLGRYSACFKKPFILLHASWQVITACPAGPDDADAKVLKAEVRSLLEDV